MKKENYYRRMANTLTNGLAGHNEYGISYLYKGANPEFKFFLASKKTEFFSAITQMLESKELTDLIVGIQTIQIPTEEFVTEAELDTKLLELNEKRPFLGYGLIGLGYYVVLVM